LGFSLVVICNVRLFACGWLTEGEEYARCFFPTNGAYVIGEHLRNLFEYSVINPIFACHTSELSDQKGCGQVDIGLGYADCVVMQRTKYVCYCVEKPVLFLQNENSKRRSSVNI